ncbi:hypothetical protein PLESTB_001518700 [Pleodorina starrii]|uniref:Uncharacterized protein n=1 Tax=Pleodorina starrii TaxID=330485 RepID=A0A9W6F8G4_9CHLO|nr:hypothetical protein PLESTM_000983100 [Pleodorina starrii]GLC59655.1 hypothetical protein PLESTB_001518700 [Pleodorina starrii]
MLQDYKAFHDANKHSPYAQYIVQTCWHRHCEGAGDRIRGTLFLLRMAIEYRKILIIDWTRPAPLPYFLTPNQIDWTMTGFPDGFFTENNTITLEEFNATTKHGPGTDEAIAKFMGTQKYVTQGVRPFEAHATRLPRIDPKRAIEIGACYFNFLFKLNSTIVERGEAHLRQLYGPSPVDYVAWHWRHMDVDSKKEEPLIVSELGTAMSCAEQLAGGIGVDLNQRPVLLVTDFNAFRHMVARGDVRKLTTPNITAKHIERGWADSVGPFQDVFVDLYILSRSRCLITSWSGFSKLALWMGSRQLLHCHRDRLHCDKATVQNVARRMQLRRRRERRALMATAEGAAAWSRKESVRNS